MSWHPIETAPKDGTHILVWNGETQTTVYWDTKLYIKRWRLVESGWGEEIDDSFDDFTHWQPLMDPPKEEN
jgi:hypothetical protein